MTARFNRNFSPINTNPEQGMGANDGNWGGAFSGIPGVNSAMRRGDGSFFLYRGTGKNRTRAKATVGPDGKVTVANWVADAPQADKDFIRDAAVTGAAAFGGLSAGGFLGGGAAGGAAGAGAATGGGAGAGSLGLAEAGAAGLAEGVGGVGLSTGGTGSLAGAGAAGAGGGSMGFLDGIAGSIGVGKADLIRGGASLLDSFIQDRSGRRALDEMRRSTDQAIGEHRRQFDLTREDFAPYREIGEKSLRELYAANGKPVTAEEVMEDPGYQFGLDQGMSAIDRKIASMGGRVSGQAIKAAGRFGTDYATTGYGAAYSRRNDRLNRLADLAGVGQTATGSTANARQNTTNNITGMITNQGDAGAASRLNRGSIWANAGNRLAAIYARGGSGGMGGEEEPLGSDFGRGW